MKGTASAAPGRWPPLLAATVLWLFGGLEGCRSDSTLDRYREDRPAVVELALPAMPSSDPRIDLIEFRSERLSAFAGSDVLMRAVVLTPPDYDPDARHPAMYSVHGFGGTATAAAARALQRARERSQWSARPLVQVFLDANHRWGHHGFADSENMGPWGTALVEELIPRIDRRYGLVSDAHGRFVTGHSSGGWASLWLAVAYPSVFGGVWSTAPDPVDFRDFTGVDLYTFDNVYRTPLGQTVQLEFRDGKPVRSLKEFVDHEIAAQPVGGQFSSFDAVFSPRGSDGAPRPLFDRQSGRIDPEVALAWRAYDISRILRTQWPRRAAGLAGKIHVIVGTRDTYGLQRPVRLLADALRALGSDAVFVFVEGRDHADLYQPDAREYPNGLRQRIEREALEAFHRQEG